MPSKGGEEGGGGGRGRREDKNTKIPVKEFPQRAPQGCNPVWFNSEGSEQGTKKSQRST
jgi:hypothetical protein